MEVPDCPICMTYFSVDDDGKPMSLHCGHSICNSCLFKLPFDNCPVCKDPIASRIAINPNYMLMSSLPNDAFDTSRFIHMLESANYQERETAAAEILDICRRGYKERKIQTLFSSGVVGHLVDVFFDPIATLGYRQSAGQAVVKIFETPFTVDFSRDGLVIKMMCDYIGNDEDTIIEAIKNVSRYADGRSLILKFGGSGFISRMLKSKHGVAHIILQNVSLHDQECPSEAIPVIRELVDLSFNLSLHSGMNLALRKAAAAMFAMIITHSCDCKNPVPFFLLINTKSLKDLEAEILPDLLKGLAILEANDIIIFDVLSMLRGENVMLSMSMVDSIFTIFGSVVNDFGSFKTCIDEILKNMVDVASIERLHPLRARFIQLIFHILSQCDKEMLAGINFHQSIIILCTKFLEFKIITDRPVESAINILHILSSLSSEVQEMFVTSGTITCLMLYHCTSYSRVLPHAIDILRNLKGVWPGKLKASIALTVSGGDYMLKMKVLKDKPL